MTTLTKNRTHTDTGFFWFGKKALSAYSIMVKSEVNFKPGIVFEQAALTISLSS